MGMIGKGGACNGCRSTVASELVKVVTMRQ